MQVYFEKEYPHHDEAKRGYETSVLERLDEQGKNGREQCHDEEFKAPTLVLKSFERRFVSFCNTAYIDSLHASSHHSLIEVKVSHILGGLLRQRNFSVVEHDPLAILLDVAYIVARLC